MLDIAKSELTVEKALLQGVHEALNLNAVDKFAHENWFFAHLPKKECADAVYGGGTITYNVLDETANFANLSACFETRGIHGAQGYIVSEWSSLMADCVQCISDLFNDMVIRGNVSCAGDQNDLTKGPAAFDGLDKIIRKESQHVWDDPLDLTDLENIDAMCVTEWLMARIRHLHPSPTFILGNYRLISVLSWLGRQTGTYTEGKDDFDHTVKSISDVNLVSMGWRSGQYGKEEIIPTEKVKVSDIPVDKRPRVNHGDYAYVTKAYVGSFGMDAVQGFILPGNAHDLYRRIVDQMMREDAVRGILPGNPVMVQLLKSGSCVKKRLSVEMLIGMRVMSRDACGMFTTVYLPEG